MYTFYYFLIRRVSRRKRRVGRRKRRVGRRFEKNSFIVQYSSGPLKGMRMPFEHIVDRYAPQFCVRISFGIHSSRSVYQFANRFVVKCIGI